MAHAIATTGGRLVALIDQAAAPPHRAPLTPASTRASEHPPAFTLPNTWPTLVQLVATLPGAAMTDDVKKHAADHVRDRVTNAWTGELRQPMPDGFTPYPWQVWAAVQYPRTRALMLADAPGTGKTFSALLGVLEAALDDPDGVTLVVCPASVVSSWLGAWRTLTGTDGARYMGPKRAKLLDDPPALLVTSYETMSRDVDKLKALDIRDLVLDEHHLIKTPSAARSKAARKLGAVARGVIALSGTPITKHAGDLWPTLNAVDPESWPSKTRFQQRYLEVVEGDYGDEVVGFLPHRRGEFDLCTAGTQRRVAKEDALPWLPPKVYQVREVELPKEWRKLYEDMRDDMVADLPDTDEPLNAMGVLAQLQYLQALAAAPCDVEVTEDMDDDGLPRKHYSAKLKGPSWKVDALMDVLSERPDEQVVVFSPSRQLIELAGAALDAAGVSHRYVVGAQSTTARDAAISDFQEGRARVILVTTAAGGVGITLTAASCAVFLSRPWSLVEALQAEDRVHRIGSERHDSVDIVDIVAKDTVDAAIRGALTDKAGALGDVLRDPRVLRDVLGGRN